MEPLGVVCKPLKLTLGGDWLLQEHLSPLESFSLVIELSSDNLVVQFSILSSLDSQVIKHLLGGQILCGQLLQIHMSLLYSKDLLFVELDHVSELSLLLSELGILLLFFPKLRCGLEESFEVLFVAFVLEQVDLCQKLLLFLVKLGDLFLQLSWVHAFLSHLVNVLMSGLELSLEIFVVLEGLSHLFIDQELIWDIKWYQIFGGICSSLKFRLL